MLSPGTWSLLQQGQPLLAKELQPSEMLFEGANKNYFKCNGVIHIHTKIEINGQPCINEFLEYYLLEESAFNILGSDSFNKFGISISGKKDSLDNNLEVCFPART